MTVPFIVGLSLVGSGIAVFILSFCFKAKKARPILWGIAYVLCIAGLITIATQAPRYGLRGDTMELPQ
jgi:hypothetical protein